MIGCPYCGKMNRRGSKYCGNCGEPLDTLSTTRCPTCNAPNLLGGETCTFCGAPLEVPSAAVEVEAQAPETVAPAAEPAQAEEHLQPPTQELPSWLYELAEDKAGESHVPVPISAPAPSEQETNKYLQDISGILPKIDGWLSSSLKRYLPSTPADQEPPSEPD